MAGRYGECFWPGAEGGQYWRLALGGGGAAG